MNTLCAVRCSTLCAVRCSTLCAVRCSTLCAVRCIPITNAVIILQLLIWLCPWMRSDQLIMPLDAPRSADYALGCVAISWLCPWMRRDQLIMPLDASRSADCCDQEINYEKITISIIFVNKFICNLRRGLSSFLIIIKCQV